MTTGSISPDIPRAEVSSVPSTREIDKFIQVFPFWEPHIVKWTPHKDGTLKVELTDKRFFIFTYWDERTWRLETVRSYEKKKE